MKRVLLFGEAMVMFVAQEAGTLATVNRYDKKIAGAELNVAIGLRRLGLDPVYVTQVGDDQFGDAIKDALDAHDIGKNLSRNHAYTGFQFKSRTHDYESDVLYYRNQSAASFMDMRNFEGIDFDTIDHIHLTGIPLAISESCREIADRLIDIAKHKGIPVSLDPNVRPTLWDTTDEMIQVINDFASRVDIFMPGMSEGRLLTNGLEDAREIATYYLEKGVREVIVKMGEDGCYYQNPETHCLIPGFNLCSVKDTVGAGDGFAVGFLYGRLKSFDVAKTLSIGNIIGALQVGSFSDNDALPDEKELMTKMREVNV